MKKFNYFTKGEIIMWAVSIFLIFACFIVFDRENYTTLAASVIGVTSLLYNSKGNAAGQALSIAFSLLYGLISFQSRYYGELITYIGMTLPMSVIALVSWLKNPTIGEKSEVKIGEVKMPEIIILIFVTAGVTTGFYFILKYFNTANLLVSTFSVATSFAAAYLSFRRSAYYPVIYALNDIVLIILWGMESIKDISYISVVICFGVFAMFDIYGFINWRKMEMKQYNDALESVKEYYTPEGYKVYIATYSEKRA